MNKVNPDRLMLTLCAMVVLGAGAMLAFGGLAFWPASDLEKSVESDREFLGSVNAGKVTCSEDTLSAYANDSLEYHRALKGGYLALARSFLIAGGAFLVLGGAQLVIVRKQVLRHLR